MYTTTYMVSHSSRLKALTTPIWQPSKHNIKFSFILLSNFSLVFKVTLPAQSDAEGKASIWELTVSVIIREKVHMTMCLILNGYWDTAVWISRHNYVRFWFMGFDEEQSLEMKGGYMRRTVCSNFRSAACIQKCDDQLRRTTQNIAHNLWSALRLMVDCLNIYCEL